MLILFKSVIFFCTHKCLSWQMLYLEPLFSFFNLYYGLCITVKALILNHFFQYQIRIFGFIRAVQ